ncbi:hypothetical protein SAMD00019534_094990, partial [Acytostelium subglobosum LB1]|uniref:hypothetical protein n=1 Tax=Acytostelium subglobosum LB1 TaxID=1410327 RepID=UPI000644BB25
MFAQNFNPNPEDPNKAGDIKMPTADDQEKKQKERARLLTEFLLTFIDPYVKGTITKNMFEDKVKEKAMEMEQGPGGAELLSLLGYVYVQEAKQHSMFGFIFEISEKGHRAGEVMSVVKSAVKMQSQVNTMSKSPDASVDSQSESLIKEGLDLIWKMGRLDIDTAVRLVCEEIMSKKNSESKVRKLRVEAIKTLGTIFEKVGNEKKRKGNGADDLLNMARPPPS